MKNYDVYYKHLLKTGPLSINIIAASAQEALELASKKTLIYKKYLTLKKPKYTEYL